MESHSSTNIKVGIFLAIGIVIILASIFFLGADKAIFRSYVRIHAEFDQVQGLAAGSVVSLSGITVGNVESIDFIPEKNTLDVKMKIDTKFVDMIRQGSQVEVRTQGALGDKFVFIIPGNPRNPAIQNGDTLEVAPATDLLGILSERGAETSKIFDIINDLHKLTSTLTKGNKLGSMIDNLEQASGYLTSSSKKADHLMAKLADDKGAEKMRDSVARLDSILTKIDRGEGTLGALVNDPTIHNQLRTMLGGSPRKNHMKSLIRTSIEKAED